MIEVARGRLSKQIARDIGIAKGTAPARNCTAELEKASRFATLTPAGRGGRRVKSCHSDQSFQWGAIMYWKHVASVGVISLLLLPGHKAWADTGLGGFGYINEGPTTARPAPPPRSKRTKQKREIAIPVPPAPAPWGQFRPNRSPSSTSRRFYSPTLITVRCSGYLERLPEIFGVVRRSQVIGGVRAPASQIWACSSMCTRLASIRT
jgi:hypothetical protein